MPHRYLLHISVRLTGAFVAAILSAPSSATAALQLTGVNLSGGEFNSGAKPGVYATDYIYPNSREINYYVGKGMNVFRLPFLWERLQRSPGQPLNAQELQRITTFVNAATSAGATVILDPHNFGKYNGLYIGSTGGPTDAQFADLWTRLATAFQGNDKVVFGLMNEPTQTSTQWVSSANAAIAAIRDAGASNTIFVPGVRYTGAHSWTSSSPGNPSNATAMLNIVDPLNNDVFEVHQYFDSDSSGTHDTIANNNSDIGVQRLQAFTNWCQANNKRGFLGEFAAANSTIGIDPSQIGDETISNMLSYMESNSDVWVGWSWWSGGPWWGNYMFTLEPTNLGSPTQQDQAAMAVLQQYTASVPEPTMMAFLGLGALPLLRRRTSEPTPPDPACHP